MNELSDERTEMSLPTLESKAEIEEPESKLVIDKKHYKEEKLNLLKGSTDYYKFYVFDKDNEPIYTEIYIVINS